MEQGIDRDNIWSYGCVRCQKHHYEGGALYKQHIGFQSKHGTQKVPVRYALVGRLPVQFTSTGGITTINPEESN